MKKKLSLRRILIIILLSLTLIPQTQAGEPVCYLLLCCRSNNTGATWLVNGEWNPSHDYNDINVVRDILQKVKDAGINTVCIDMSNPSMWHSEQFRAYHMPMCDNVRKVAAEKGMKYFILLGGQISYCLQDLIDLHVPGVYPGMTGPAYWNMIAAEVLTWAKADNNYKTYGYDGDNRPLLGIFLPGSWWANDLANTPPADKANLVQFWHGTDEINGPNNPVVASDGWGYRNDSQNADGSVRFTSPNGAENPSNYYRLSEAEFRSHVQWVKGASKYSIYGSYDDVCDEINWGISDTRNSTTTTNLYPQHNPTAYYNIIQEELVGCLAAAGTNSGVGLDADYFNNNDFSGTPVLKRIEPQINIAWGASSPSAAVNADNFCVQLKGQIEAPYSGYYTFFGNADDYEKLVIDGHTLFDDGAYSTQDVGTTPIRLEAGKKYDITYQMKEGIGGAGMKLEWTTACLPREVVPTTRFYPASVPLKEQTQYNGPHNIPSTIEAEDFDNGGEGVAYHDTDPTNSGAQYRTTEGVDIQAANGGYVVGWTNAGEWLEYTVNVQQTGLYAVNMVTSSPSGGQASIAFNGIDKTGTIAISATGANTTYGSVLDSVFLTAGQQIMRINILTNGFNIDKLTFTLVPGTTPESNGDGLTGNYYQDNYAFNLTDWTQSQTETGAWNPPTSNITWFTTPKTTRVDQTINVAKGSLDAFLTGLNGIDKTKAVSVKWTGALEFTTPGTYTFYLSGADGLRLKVNNNNIIGNFASADPAWVVRAYLDANTSFLPLTGTMNVTLKMVGIKFPIGLEFYSVGVTQWSSLGDRGIKLEWENTSSGISKQIIPKSQLYSTDITTNISKANNEVKEQIQIFPNPATNQLTINSGQLSISQIVITDLQGRMVYQNNNTFTNSKTIDISSLSKGIYFVSLKTEQAIIKQKVVIQ